MIIRKFKTLIGFEKPMVILEAYFFMIISKLALSFLSFSRIANMMGEVMGESSKECNNEKKELKIISDAIKISDRNIPMKTECYVQALTARLMINRRNQESTIYIGVMKNQDGETKGHAWLRSGQFIVTGKNRHEDYQIIATYS